MSHLRLLSALTAVGAAVALLAGCRTDVMLTAASVTVAEAQATAVPPAPAGWRTVFGDGFGGRSGSAPSAGNWFYDIGTGYGTGEVEHTTNSTKNVYLDGHGHLVLKATRSGSTWTSARIETTRDDFQAPAGGKLEMTASIEQPDPANGRGYWPAFWALGSPIRAGGGWPASGELDMMEDVNGLDEASQTLHDAAGSGGHPLIACHGSTCESGYHTYSVIINRTNTRAEYLQFLMDGRVTKTITEAQVGATAWHEAIEHGFFIILDLAMGGDYPDGMCNCTTPAASTSSGASMSVRYVAVYEKSGNSRPTARPTRPAALPGATGGAWPTRTRLTPRASPTPAATRPSGSPPRPAPTRPARLARPARARPRRPSRATQARFPKPRTSSRNRGRRRPRPRGPGTRAARVRSRRSPSIPRRHATPAAERIRVVSEWQRELQAVREDQVGTRLLRGPGSERRQHARCPGRVRHPQGPLQLRR